MVSLPLTQVNFFFIYFSLIMERTLMSDVHLSLHNLEIVR